ncbi:hypothetical protein KS18_19055 [Photorhabdus luminescens]|nr:hypothetical protein KS18_19055 [Photorhabdus luminescens]
MAWNLIKANIVSELYGMEFTHTLYIRKSGEDYILWVEPEFRRNGRIIPDAWLDLDERWIFLDGIAAR